MKSLPLLIQKKMLREECRIILAGMTEAARKKKSRKIMKALFKTQLFQRAKRLFTYISLPEEVNTLQIIEKALSLGKRVYVPKMKSGENTFVIREIFHAKKSFKKGRYGVLEPVAGRRGSVRSLDLILVPGLAFDQKGHRLGRGKGFFDRFLKKAVGIPTLGLAFKEQIVNKIPSQSHDQRVDLVITD